MDDDALESVLLNKEELIASLRKQLLFWAQEYSDVRNELLKLKGEHARLQGLAHKAAEIVLHGRGVRWER